MTNPALNVILLNGMLMREWQLQIMHDGGDTFGYCKRAGALQEKLVRYTVTM